VDTLLTFFRDTGTRATDYDLILTGDLGKLGKDIFVDMLRREGYDVSENCADCGASLYYEEQQTYQGGSGAACSAIVFNSLILNNINKGNMNKIILIGTGALMSPTSSFQGEAIPAIAHLVEICTSKTTENFSGGN
jgi:stage V sporulation protein AD